MEVYLCLTNSCSECNAIKYRYLLLVGWLMWLSDGNKSILMFWSSLYWSYWISVLLLTTRTTKFYNKVSNTQLRSIWSELNHIYLEVCSAQTWSRGLHAGNWTCDHCRTVTLYMGCLLQLQAVQWPDLIALDGITLGSSSTVRNLWVTFDQDLSFKSRIKQVSPEAFFHLCNVSKMRNIFYKFDAEKLICYIKAGLLQCHFSWMSKSIHPLSYKNLIVSFQPKRTLCCQTAGLLTNNNNLTSLCFCALDDCN